MSKVILVTGASSGIGKECVEHLAQDGHIVYGVSRRPYTYNFPNIHHLQMDVTDRASIANVVALIIKEQGRLDVVMNNAGAGIVGALEFTTEEELNFQMGINFNSVVNVCSAVLPQMRAQGSGTIINVSSVGGVMGLPFQGLYSASKFAIEGYSEALRFELHPFGINVAMIEPGDFNTGFTGSRKVSELTLTDPAYKDQFKKTLKIIEDNENSGGDPKKIARLVARIAKKNKTGFRYPVGNIGEHLPIFVKRLVPGRFYQWILRQYYQIK